MTTMDANALLQADKLPRDPADGAEPMPKGTTAERQPDAADPFKDHWKPLADAMPDLWTKPLTEPRWLLERGSADKRRGVLRMGKVGLFVAAGGVGKTQALVQLALAVAVSKATTSHKASWWFDTFHVATPGRVLLALAEEDADEIRRRLRIAADALSLSASQRADVLRNIVALPLAGTPVGLVARDQAGNVTQTPLLDALKAKLASTPEDQPWSLVVLDPLSRWAGPDSEKDNAAATRFIEAVETLVSAHGLPAVLVAHHAPKASKDGSVAVSARGASALTDGARWVATLVPDETRENEDPLPFEAVTLTIIKSNYAERGEPVILTRDKRHSGALRLLEPGETTSYAALQEKRRRGKRSTANGGNTANGGGLTKRAKVTDDEEADDIPT